MRSLRCAIGLHRRVPDLLTGSVPSFVWRFHCVRCQGRWSLIRIAGTTNWMRDWS